MRPIQLTMQSFGSYKAKTVIRFDGQTQNLFLITGDTGSGKSTIFDAISFALYDKVSSERNNKDNRSLKSQYTDVNETPFVELIFSNNHQQYKIHRTPIFERLITRGKNKGNLVSDSATVLLYQLDDNGEWVAINGKKAELDRKIQDIVGLTKEQFVKVAMIAQGEFLNFILEKSEDKKKSFRSLFKTQIYEEFGKKLKDMTSASAKDKKLQEEKIGMIAAMVKLPSSVENTDAVAEELSAVLSGNMAEIESFSADLAALCEQLDSETQTLSEKVRLTQELRDEKVQIRTEATELAQHYNTLLDAQKDLQRCTEQEEPILQKQQLITQIRNAYAIQNKYQAYVSVQKKRESNASVLSNCQKRLPILHDELQKSTDTLQTINADYTAEYERYIQLRDEVRHAKEVFSEIAKNEQGLQHCEKEIAFCIQQKSKSEKQLADCTESEKKTIAEQSTLHGFDVKLAECHAQQQSLDTLSKNIASFERKAKDFRTLQKNAEQSQKDYELAKAKFQAQQQKMVAMREIFYDNQAGILAQKLEENKPCPVCGSTHHPAPYLPKDFTEEITKAQLDNAEKDLSQLNENFIAQSQKSGDAAAQAQNSKQSCMELFRDLKATAMTVVEGIDPQAHLSKIKEKVTLAVTQNQQNIQHCTEQIKRYKACSERLEILAQQKETITQQIAQSDENLQQFRLEKKRLETNLFNLKKDLCFSSLQEVNEQFQQETDKTNRLNTQKNDAEKQVKTFQQNITQLEENIKHGIQTEQETAAECEQLFNEYTAMLTDRQMTAPEWQSIVSQYREKDIDDFQIEIDRYTQQKTKAQTIQATMLKAIRQRPRPDLEQIQNEVEQAETALSAIRQQQTAIAELSRTNAQAHAQLTAVLSAYILVAQKYQRLSNLYNTFQKGSDKMKVDLETYAQRYYLEQILDAANTRLLEMSSGEYEIKLVDLDERLSSQSNQGLNLMVYCHTTHTERDIQTLSGGESFMAALALALGMSDRIKASIPVLDLNIMFIDEGFGSLDDTSRRQAVQVLKNIAGGNKMVGIISHVTELKQQIDDQLVVTKDDNGSHVQWKH